MSEDSSLKRTRASGETLEYLLREFDINQNPNTDQRKEISEYTGMTEKAVRIWFQNRRAKLRKFERLGKTIKSPNGLAHPEPLSLGPSRSSLISNMPTAAKTILDNHQASAHPYYLVNCLSLSVGSWQRVKLGENNPALINTMENLAPFTVDKFMSDVDLLVIVSRKNNEINYFFSAMANDSKILFRIFYPITSVISCSLLDNSISRESNELRVCLSIKPQFSVNFFNGVNANLNQWSICDDFSEDHQVSSAYFLEGGEKIPHVLVGEKQSLEALYLFLVEYAQGPHPHPAYQNILSGPVGNINAQKFRPRNTPSEYSHSSSHIDLHAEHIAKDDYHLKHEMNSWNGSTPSDLRYDLKEKVHTASALDSRQLPIQSSNRYVPPLSMSMEHELFQTTHRKADGSFSELFTESPEFFSTVQTSHSNNLVASHNANQENVLHSPFANIHAFHSPSGALKKGSEEQQANATAPSGGNYEASYQQLMDATNRNFGEASAHHYGFDMNIGNDYQENPGDPTNTTTSGHAASTNNVDTFIDYNGNL